MPNGRSWSAVKHQAVIHMLDGAVWKGTVDTNLDDDTFAGDTDAQVEIASNSYFESSDGQRQGRIPVDGVRIIFPRIESGPQLPVNLRFFDSAPIPSFLWIRLTFVSGEVVEGMVKNRLAALNGPLISLSLPHPDTDQVLAYIPRSAIAELQIITTR